MLPKITLESFKELIKSAYTLEVDGLLLQSYCIFDEPENDCFLWITLDNNLFIKFYQEDNQEIRHDERGLYLMDEMGIIFGILPIMKEIVND